MNESKNILELANQSLRNFIKKTFEAQEFYRGQATAYYRERYPEISEYGVVEVEDGILVGPKGFTPADIIAQHGKGFIHYVCSLNLSEQHLCPHKRN